MEMPTVKQVLEGHLPISSCPVYLSRAKMSLLVALRVSDSACALCRRSLMCD